MRIRHIAIGAALVACCLIDVTQAQERLSAVEGIVSGHDGARISEAPIRVQNESLGVDARTFSSDEGNYTIRDLPAGTYMVTVQMPCCAFSRYANDAVVIETGETLEFNIVLQEGGSLNVLADDPGTLNAEIRSRQIIPDLPVPRNTNGQPDLSGLWLIRSDPFPERPQALPWAEELAAERRANEFREHPHTLCLPSNPTRPGGAAPFMMKFVQTPDLLVLLYEDVPGFRQIFLDGRVHPGNLNPTWMGHSIGRWEGETLVVSTLGFNDRGWNDAGYPRTEGMHLEERFTRTDYGTMDVRVTITDPGVFVSPWVQNLRFNLAPQEELLEYVCENNKWAPELSQD